jgi:hypothetical protein
LPNEGIALTTPVLLGDPASGTETVGVLAWNLTSTVNSYSLKAEFTNGSKTTATGAAIVNDHRPGDLRPVQLLIDSGTPSATDTLTVTLDEMISQVPSSETANVASQVTFGTPTVTEGATAPQIAVDVTNGSTTHASFAIIAGVMRDGVLVGIGTGTVDLEAGQTGSALLDVSGEAASTDFIVFDVDSVVTE